MCIYVDDLKAFERRLTDVVSQLQPIAVRWRGTDPLIICLCFLLHCTLSCAYISVAYLG